MAETQLKGTSRERTCSHLWLLLSRTCLVALAWLLAACATTTPDHTFEFTPRADSPSVKVLDWHYGELRPAEWEKESALRSGRGLSGTSTTGRIRAGDHIYLKWQALPGMEIHERRIELRGLLPFDMDHKRIVVMFRGTEPFVYLVSIEPRRCHGEACSTRLSSDVTPVARSYTHGVIRQIHPNPRN